MKLLLAAVQVAALAASPVSAQRASRLHLGITATSMHRHVSERTRAGAYAGMSFDVRDDLCLGVPCVQKADEELRVHSIEVPVL